MHRLSTTKYGVVHLVRQRRGTRGPQQSSARAPSLSPLIWIPSEGHFLLVVVCRICIEGGTFIKALKLGLDGLVHQCGRVQGIVWESPHPRWRVASVVGKCVGGMNLPVTHLTSAGVIVPKV
jgi:hypothetical protein